MKDKTAKHKLIVYGHNHCAQARILARALKEHEIPYEWRDVLEGDHQYKANLRGLANGNLSVPTVIFPDGSVLVEPFPGQVMEKLGIESKSPLDRLLQRLQRRKD